MRSAATAAGCWEAHQLHGSTPEGIQGGVIATYDAAFRAGFDRQITDWATGFLRPAHQEGRPFYAYRPYTQVHIPPIPDPEYAGTTRHGNLADLLTQMDAFTGRILDELDALGIAQDTIVVWASDNGADPNYRYPPATPIPSGVSGPGSRGPGGAATSPPWKLHLFQQDVAASTFSPYNASHLHNLEWDPREEHEINLPHGWVIHRWPPPSARSSKPGGRTADQARHLRPPT